MFMAAALLLFSGCGLGNEVGAPTQPPTPPATEADEEPEESATEELGGALPADSYTLDEVATHDNPDDCWLAIDDKVYDVTGYDAQHPGGNAVYEGYGTDATELFETRPMGSGTPHSERARSFLPNFEIGVTVTE